MQPNKSNLGNRTIKFDLSKVNFSKGDLIREITIPKEMNGELAELIGILVGDGHIRIQWNNLKTKKFLHHMVVLSGHRIDDFSHYKNRINYLFKKLFNIDIKIKKPRTKENALRMVINSKVLVIFLSKMTLLPLGKKSSIIQIPDCIKLSSDKIKLSFLKGLADTDFSITFKKRGKDVHYYPVIKCKFKSRKIIGDIKVLLNKFGFRIYCQYDYKRYDHRTNKVYNVHSIDLNGKENLRKWMDLINFNNPKHLTKYQIWKKFGFCPPYTNIEERRKILKGEINPYSYYGPVA